MYKESEKEEHRHVQNHEPEGFSADSGHHAADLPDPAYRPEGVGG